MISRSNIICFAATKNAKLAKRFYQKILGLRLVEDGPYALVYNANGTMLRVQKVQHHTPARHTSLGWQVKNIRSEIKTLSKKGVRFEQYEGMVQDELGIWTTPDGAQIAWFLDPDGNTLSLTQWPD